jgi:hypothetical protein
MTLARSSDSSWALGNELRPRFEPAGADEGKKIGAEDGICWRRDGVETAGDDWRSPRREERRVSTMLLAGCLAGVPNPRCDDGKSIGGLDILTKVAVGFGKWRLITKL